MCKLFTQVIFLSTAVFLSAAAHGDPQVVPGKSKREVVEVYPGVTLDRTITYKTYKVRAGSFEEWANHINSNPLPHQPQAVGLTENSLSYAGKMMEGESGCHPHSFVLTQDISVIFPEVVFGKSLTPDETAVMRMVSDFVMNHEHLHLKDAVDMGTRITGKIHKAGGRMSCSDFDNHIKVIVRDEWVWFGRASRYVDETASWDYMMAEIKKRIPRLQTGTR
jgi:predicted secreted Zn-dependent protease